MARRSLRRKRTRNKRRRSNMKTRRSVHGGRRSRRRRQRRRQRSQRRRILRGGWGLGDIFGKSKEARERDARLKADEDSREPSQGQASIAKLHAHDAKVKAAGGHAELAKQEEEAKRRETYGKHGEHAVHVDWNVEDVEAGVRPEAVRTATSPSILGQTGKDEYGEGRTAAAPARRIKP